MGDQDELEELRRRFNELEEAYNKDKKKRDSLVALLRLAFIKVKQVYDTLTEGEDPFE